MISEGSNAGPSTPLRSAQDDNLFPATMHCCHIHCCHGSFLPEGCKALAAGAELVEEGGAGEMEGGGGDGGPGEASEQKGDEVGGIGLTGCGSVGNIMQQERDGGKACECGGEAAEDLRAVEAGERQQAAAVR